MWYVSYFFLAVLNSVVDTVGILLRCPLMTCGCIATNFCVLLLQLSLKDYLQAARASGLQQEVPSHLQPPP